MADMEVDQVRSKATTKKGRGFQKSDSLQKRDMDVDHPYESYVEGSAHDSGKFQRSVEGWIVFVTGVHEEAQEDTIVDKFSDYGTVQNIHLNLDRRTGFVKGYALVEYAEFEEAKAAAEAMNGTQLYDQIIHCDFAFVRNPGAAAARRNRSKSPARR